jgi:hypothetical protein
VPDIEQDPEIWSANLETAPRALGYRSVLVVSMLREGLPMGTIAVLREHAERFSDACRPWRRSCSDSSPLSSCLETVRPYAR